MTHDSYYPQLRFGKLDRHSLNSQSSWRTHQSWSCQYPRGRRYCPQGWHHTKGEGNRWTPTETMTPKNKRSASWRGVRVLPSKSSRQNDIANTGIMSVLIYLSKYMCIYISTSMHIICAKCTRKSQHMWVCQNQINMSFKKQVEVFRAFRTPPSEYPAPLLHLGQDTAPSVEVVLFRPNG